MTREYLFKQNKWGTGSEGVRKDFLTTGWLERNIPFTYSYSKNTLRGSYEQMRGSSELYSPAVKLIRVLDRGLDRVKIVVAEEDMGLFPFLIKYINLDFTELPHRENPKADKERSLDWSNPHEDPSSVS